jgi:hypothetical protein
MHKRSKAGQAYTKPGAHLTVHELPDIKLLPGAQSVVTPTVFARHRLRGMVHLALSQARPTADRVINKGVFGLVQCYLIVHMVHQKPIRPQYKQKHLTYSQ